MGLEIIFFVAYLVLFIHLILIIFSCNKYYFIIDSVIISIITFLILIIKTDYINSLINSFLIFYCCIRGFVVLISFIIKSKNKCLIKLKNCNFNHILFMGINVIINLTMLLSSVIDRFFDKLFCVLKVGSIILMTIVVSVMAIKYLIEKANKKDPSGNAKRILLHKIIAAVAGIIVTAILNLIYVSLVISVPEMYLSIVYILSIVPTIVIIIIACIYSPVSGFLACFVGNIIFCLIIHGYNVWFWLKEAYFYIPAGLYGLIIGFIWQKFTSGKDKIQIKTISIFCLTQLIYNIIFGLIFSIPHLDLFIDNIKKFYIHDIIQIIIIGVILFIYKNNKKINIRPHCT